MLINFNQIDFSRLSIERVEFISFVYKIKPAIFCLADDFGIDLIKKILKDILPKERLYFIESQLTFFESSAKLKQRFDKKYGIIFKNKEQKWFVVSRDKKISKSIFSALRKLKFNKVGKLLGYPPCCSNLYANFSLEDSFFLKNSIIHNILKRTKGKPVFYNNNIYNFSGRLMADDAKNFEKLNKINKNHSFQHYLIFHNPCSYRCKKSVNIGKKILDALKKYDPATARETEKVLKKPVLFFDPFNWITFNGVVGGSHIFYKSIAPPFSLINRNVISRIEGGDELFVQKNKITIFLREKIIDTISFNNSNPIILDFNHE